MHLKLLHLHCVATCAAATAMLARAMVVPSASTRAFTRQRFQAIRITMICDASFESIELLTQVFVTAFFAQCRHEVIKFKEEMNAVDLLAQLESSVLVIYL